MNAEEICGAGTHVDSVGGFFGTPFGQPRSMERARSEHEARDDDEYERDWMEDEEDKREQDARAWGVLSTAVPCPPATVTRMEWGLYKRVVRTYGFLQARPPRPEFPLGRGVPVAARTRAELEAAVDHRDTRILNVQQPWASLIALGVKDVENRTGPLVHNFGENHCCVLILASANKTSQAKWRDKMYDADLRVYWNAGFDSTDLPVLPRDRERDFPYQSVVALAWMRCAGPKSARKAWVGKQSIWNNGDEYAWEVLEVHSLLHDPVNFGRGFQTAGVFATPRDGDKSGRFARMRRAVKDRLLPRPAWVPGIYAMRPSGSSASGPSSA